VEPYLPVLGAPADVVAEVRERTLHGSRLAAYIEFLRWFEAAGADDHDADEDPEALARSLPLQEAAKTAAAAVFAASVDDLSPFLWRQFRGQVVGLLFRLVRDGPGDRSAESARIRELVDELEGEPEMEVRTLVRVYEKLADLMEWADKRPVWERARAHFARRVAALGQVSEDAPSYLLATVVKARWALALSCYRLGKLALHDDLPRAGVLADEGLPHAEAAAVYRSDVRHKLGALRAEVLVATGEPEAAWDHLARLIDDYDGLHEPSLVLVVVKTRLALDDPAGARRLLEEAKAGWSPREREHAEVEDAEGLLAEAEAANQAPGE
jgi:hypothetical protein